MTGLAAVDMVDLQFVLRGTEVSADHADALWLALRAALPWLDAEETAGIHPLSGLSPGIGRRYLSRHARLTLRLPRHRGVAAGALAGTTLVVGEDCLEIGACSQRELAPSAVLHAKFVAFSEAGADEMAFLATCERELGAFGAAPQIVCGKARQATTAAGTLHGFSLMVYGLKPEETVRLQQYGLGGERKRGCGIFLPHKSIAAVGALE